MVRVDFDNMAAPFAEAQGDVRPIDGQKLLQGLRQQLDLADQLGLDLVALRIAESLDQLAADLGQDHRATALNSCH